MSVPRRDASAALLAGGQSRRFGSDKALALFRGQPLVAWTAAALSARFAETLLVAKEPANYFFLVEAADVRAIRDLSPFQTPLAGLSAALENARHELVFVCAVDMPFAADDRLLAELFVLIEGRDAAVPVFDQIDQPLCALWRRSACLQAARELLRDGKAGPRALLKELSCARIEWRDGRVFADADTPEQLARLQEEP